MNSIQAGCLHPVCPGLLIPPILVSSVGQMTGGLDGGEGGGGKFLFQIKEIPMFHVVVAFDLFPYTPLNLRLI